MIHSFVPGSTNSRGNNLRRSSVFAFCVAASAIFLLALSLFVAPAGAQVPTGSILGTITDAQGLPVEGATVTLTNQGTNYQLIAETKGNGEYQFRSINAGLYTISVAKAGFKGGIVTDIKLDAATEYTVKPIGLEVGAQNETVTVEAGTENIQASNAEVTGTVVKRQIEELPILNRNPLNLISLQAGVANSGPGGAAVTTINGQRASFSNLTLDGINIQDTYIRENALDFSPNQPFLSQVQEFTITQQNGDVEKGGSSSVSMVTPRGSNNLHGEGFWYYRTNAWKANDWFNAASGTPTPGLLQNQGGGDLGGPIIKNKLFLYGYYELLRLHSQSPSNTTILSPEILAGLASGSLPFTYQPLDRTTGLPSGPVQTQDLLSIETTNANRGCGGPPCQPPATVFTIDPTMLAVIQRLPTTSNNTRVGDRVNLLGYQFNARSNSLRDNYGFRSDYDLNSHNSFTGTFAYNRLVVDRPDIDLTFNKVPVVFNDDHEKFLSTAWRWNPNANLTNEVRFGFNLAPGYFLTKQSFSSGMTINPINFPFTGPDANFLPQGRNTHTFAYQDNASWIHGNHLIKAGIQMQRITVARYDSAGIYPDLTTGFSSNNATRPARNDFPAPPGARITVTDFNNARDLLAAVAGVLNNVTQTFNVNSQTSGYVPLQPVLRNLSQNNWAIYLGDNWKISRKLTFNYGVRWDYFSPVDEKKGLELLPVPQPGQTIEQTLLSDSSVDFAGGPSKRKLWNPNRHEFAPNIGLAWDPFGNGRTAVRAGFSMSYVNDSFFTAAENATGGNAGLSTIVAADPGNGLGAGFTVSNPPSVPVPAFNTFPVKFSTNAAALGVSNNVAYAIDPSLKAPYLEQWNLSIQRQLGSNNSITVQYVGNHGVGLLRAIDVNQVIIGPNGFLAGFNQARANGFASLAANGTFDPSYAGPGGTGVPAVFQNICGAGANGFIDAQLGFINDEIQQGFIGDLATLYRTNDCSPSANFFAPNELILGGDLLKNASFSTYNAGIVEFKRRLSSGFYLQANYTYSKVLTDFGTSVNGDQGRFQPYLDNARPRLSRGRAPFDLTHAFKANFTYDLPIGKGHHFSSDRRALRLLLDGWQTGSIFTWQSGTPYSIVSRQSTFNRAGSRSAQNTAVATLTPGQINGNLGVFVQPGGVVYLINPKLVSADGTGAPASNGLTCDPAVPGGFCNPQPGEVGNLQLYAFTSPSYFDWDLSASKRFNITERVGLTFRTEAFNVLNHPVFAPPFDANGIAVMNINSQNFGQSLSTISAPRILQMSLRLSF